MYMYTYAFPTQISSTYRISLSTPQGCNQSSGGCNFFLGINTNSENSSYLDFTLEAKVKGWVAIGFSKTPDMVSAQYITVIYVAVMLSVVHTCTCYNSVTENINYNFFPASLNSVDSRCAGL